jgi:hypothetical protein
VFRNTTTHGIFIGVSPRPALIEDNVVVPGPERFPGHASWGNGIYVDGNGGPVRIRRNTVVCENPSADGIIVDGLVDSPTAGNVIEKNEVEMRGSLWGASWNGARHSNHGGWSEVAARSHAAELPGLTIRVLDLDAVIESKEAADRPKDRAALPLLRETLRLSRERGEE